jgi:hypothetical protein
MFQLCFPFPGRGSISCKVDVRLLPSWIDGVAVVHDHVLSVVVNCNFDSINRERERGVKCGCFECPLLLGLERQKLFFHFLGQKIYLLQFG